tara:strand:+ start:5873 stop:9301 length:3429 start_codon:yes stop_codon:yes gene_type:complete
MSPMMFPFLTGMVPPLVKEKLGQSAPQQPVIEEETRPIVEEVTRVGQPVGIGNFQQAFMQRGPLSGLSQFINQELAQENQGEVQEFIGEVGDMANQRFGVDLGSVGQRPMFDVGRPVQAYADGGAAFPDLSGDGKITQKDILIGRGVIEKEYGGPIGMQMGGDPMMAAAMPMPPQPAQPMPAPEQPPMPMEAPQDQLDPNVVQNALAQAAGGIGDLDQAQNYEQVMNTMRGDQATVEERRQELAGVVGPGDAGQTPESVLTLVQPVMMLANVDQGIGQLAQQEMTQPMEGPMAGGIMSTVPEPPMEAGGTAPVNFNKGGEVRPVEYFSPLNSNRIAGGGNQFSFNPAFPYIPTGESPINLLRVTGLLGQSGDEDAENKVNNALNEENKNPGTGKSRLNQLFESQLDLYRKVGLGDVAERQAMAEQQKRMTKAQMLFDIATAALAFAAPMEGERPGLSPAERLAMAARSTQLPEKIGARAQAQLQLDKEASKEERAIELAALQSAETKLAAEKAESAAERLAAIKSKTTAKAQKAYKTTKEITIGGKIVPKNTVVNLNPTQVAETDFGDLVPYKAPSESTLKAYTAEKDFVLNGNTISKGTVVNLSADQVSNIAQGVLIPFRAGEGLSQKPYTTLKEITIDGTTFPANTTVNLNPTQVDNLPPDSIKPFKEASEALKAYTVEKETEIDGETVSKGTVVNLTERQAAKIPFGILVPYSPPTVGSTSPFLTARAVEINGVTYAKNTIVNLKAADVDKLEPDSLVPYKAPTEQGEVNLLFPDGTVKALKPGTDAYEEAIEGGAIKAGVAKVPDDEELMGSKTETASIKYITNQERLDAYADGSLDRQETNEFEQKLLNFISKPSMVPFQGEFRVGSVPQLSPAIKRAISARRAKGLPTVNLPGQTDLPSVSGATGTQPAPQQDLQYGTKQFNLSLFDPVQGNVNLDSPSWDKVPTNLVDKNLNYPETTGLASGLPRLKVFFKEQFRELGGSPLNQSQKDFSRAESVIVSLRNEILKTITKGMEDEAVGKILKFVQLELAQETEQLTPGMFTTDETALSKLLAVESKLANSIQVLAKRIPEYGGDPGQLFNMSQITKARAMTDKLVLLTAEIRNMRKIYQEALQTGAIAVTPETTKKAKDWLKGNRG